MKCVARFAACVLLGGCVSGESVCLDAVWCAARENTSVSATVNGERWEFLGDQVETVFGSVGQPFYVGTPPSRSVNISVDNVTGPGTYSGRGGVGRSIGGGQQTRYGGTAVVQITAYTGDRAEGTFSFVATREDSLPIEAPATMVVSEGTFKVTF